MLGLGQRAIYYTIITLLAAFDPKICVDRVCKSESSDPCSANEAN
jgi:hypothetical protein